MAEKVKALKAQVAAAKKQLTDALGPSKARAEDLGSSDSVIVDDRDDDIEILDADIGRS